MQIIASSAFLNKSRFLEAIVIVLINAGNGEKAMEVAEMIPTVDRDVTLKKIAAVIVAKLAEMCLRGYLGPPD